MAPSLVSLFQALGLIVTGFAAAIAALVLMSMRSGPKAATEQAVQAPDIAFLFEGETLVDATDAAARLLALSEPFGSDINRLISFLTPGFADLHDKIMQCGRNDAIEILSSDGLSRLRLRSGEERLRLTLEDVGPDGSGLTPDRHSLSALETELDMHRALGQAVPFPLWRQTADGRVTWANAAYRDLAADLGKPAKDQVIAPRIFDVDHPDTGSPGTVQRASLDIPRQTAPRWFEFQINRIASDILVAAIPVDRVIRAERSLHDFVQTLTQTFAHLSVGLAIFNRNRELVVFNPALSDLLILSPEFLITRPTLFQLFDRLREQRFLPEPKNYNSWCRRMSALESAAADGVYSETWSLVDGRTYRITGRPHPEGAVAFMFEDISAEITLERRFRVESRMGQAILDGLDEAIAVFDRSGALSMSNRAYRTLWPEFPDMAAPDERTFPGASRRWQSACVPTPVWGDARDFSASFGERSNWNADVRMRDGRRIACRFETLPGGCTLAGFREIDELAAGQRPAKHQSASA